jgi:hypothetical protein
VSVNVPLHVLFALTVTVLWLAAPTIDEPAPEIDHKGLVTPLGALKTVVDPGQTGPEGVMVNIGVALTFTAATDE